MPLIHTYIAAIGAGFPGVQCSSMGDGSVYSDIIWEAGTAMPSQADVDAWILANNKTEMWSLIKSERDRRQQTGGYKVGDYWFHSDDSSRIRQLALVMTGANLPSDIMWKTMSGSFVLMTPTLAAQIFQAAMASDAAIFTIAEQKKAEMLASSDPHDYDYLSGWPLIYGE